MLLEVYPAAASIPDPSGMLPIHQVAKWGPSCPGVVDILFLSNRFKGNAKTKDGMTPLDIAIGADYAMKDEVVEALTNLSWPAPVSKQSGQILERRAALSIKKRARFQETAIPLLPHPTDNSRSLSSEARRSEKPLAVRPPMRSVLAQYTFSPNYEANWQGKQLAFELRDTLSISFDESQNVLLKNIETSLEEEENQAGNTRKETTVGLNSEPSPGVDAMAKPTPTIDLLLEGKATTEAPTELETIQEDIALTNCSFYKVVEEGTIDIEGLCEETVEKRNLHKTNSIEQTDPEATLSNQVQEDVAEVAISKEWYPWDAAEVGAEEKSNPTEGAKKEDIDSTEETIEVDSDEGTDNNDKRIQEGNFLYQEVSAGEHGDKAILVAETMQDEFILVGEPIQKEGTYITEPAQKETAPSKDPDIQKNVAFTDSSLESTISAVGSLRKEDKLGVEQETDIADESNKKDTVTTKYSTETASQESITLTKELAQDNASHNFFKYNRISEQRNLPRRF